MLEVEAKMMVTGGQTPKLTFHEGENTPLNPLLIEGK
jgi:hypothetical protein